LRLIQTVELVSDDIPVIYATDRALLLNTGQRQSDMDGHNDAGRNTHHCRDCVSLQYGGGNVAAREFSSLKNSFPARSLHTPFMRNYGAYIYFYENDETEFSKKLRFS